MVVPVDRPGRHGAVMHRQGRQKTGRPVSLVRGGQPPGLDLGLLVHREDQGVFRRVRVKSQNRRLFRLELRVGTATGN